MKFSFIVPAYCAEKTVAKCLDSFLAQTYENWEAIVVDDGSKDSTFQIMEAYAQKDPRIKIFTHSNRGPGLTRNAAMDKATGDFFCFTDSDDYIEPDYLQSVAERIKQDRCDVVVLDNYYENARGELIRMETLSQFAHLDKNDLIAVQMTGKMPWGGCRKVVSGSIIRDHAIAYSSDPVGEEALFSFRVFYHAEKISFLGKPVFHYVDYPTSQSKKGNDDPWGDVVKRIAAYLKEQGIFEQFEPMVNSFAATALVVSLYRLCTNHSFFRALKYCREKVAAYKQVYKTDLYPLSLETRVKLMMVFVRMGILFPVVFIAKAKKLLDKR